jgi:hypothetical protein
MQVADFVANKVFVSQALSMLMLLFPMSIKEKHDALMPSPKEEREGIPACRRNIRKSYNKRKERGIITKNADRIRMRRRPIKNYMVMIE